MLALTASESNSYGAALLGGSLSLSDAVRRIADGAVAVIVENDLHRRLPADGLDLGRAIVVDYLETPTAESAAVVLPAATYAEQTGTFVNYETRAQRFYQVFEPTDEVAPSWRWISAIASALGRNDLDWDDMDALTMACAAAGDELAGLAEVAPGAGFRVAADSKIPRQPQRYSGRTAMRANVSVHEPKTTVDHETPFSYSMEGLNTGDQPGAVLPYVWSPGWNSNQSVFKFQQEVAGALAGGDPGARLIGTSGDTRHDRYEDVPAPANVDVSNGTFLAARASYVFGGDELSAASAPILERTPAPYVLLNPEDARRLGVSDGNGVAIAELGASYEVRVDDSIASGIAGVARGLPGTGVLRATHVNLAADPDFVRRPGGDPNLIAKG
ncbi:MAG: molybdopterin-dependent oxidoreductase [Gammaproteobacteria bacterium]|nr:molybdopterin-dependent oxidoreductase [Gammaproteobacteria bacterium]